VTFRSRKWLIALGIFLCLAVAIFIFRSNGKSDLEKLKADLRIRGEKLTFAEFYQPQGGSQRERFDAFLRATDQLQGEVHPGMLRLMDHVSSGKARIAWVQPAVPVDSSPLYPYPMHRRGGASLIVAATNSGAIQNSQPTNTWKSFASELARNEDSLSAIREFLEDPPVDSGWDYRNSFGSWPRFTFVQQRKAAQWLTSATLNDLHAQDLDAALNNIHALVMMASLHREDPTLVNQMIRVAICGLGFGVTWEALAATNWNEAQLVALQKDWAQINPIANVEKGLVGVRASGLAMFAAVRADGRNLSRVFGGGAASRVNVGERIMIGLWRSSFAEKDEWFYLQHIQKGIDGIRLFSRQGKSWTEVDAGMRQQVIEIETVCGSFNRYEYFLSAISIPNFQKALQTACHNEIHRRLTLCAIALKRHQLRHGKLPETLDALVPEFLSAVPLDFDQKPLRYHTNTDGSFLLYSVGEDCRDADGNGTPFKGKKFGLWESPDAVWPAPVLSDENASR
jgi:hypothetical protein